LAKATIVIHKSDLDDVGLSPQTPVSIRFRDVPLDTVLDLSLRELDLAWRRDGGTIHVITPEAAEANPETWRYPLADLVEPNGRDDSERRLAEILTNVIAPWTWEAIGGYGSVVIEDHALVVIQTHAVHREIAAFLGSLQSALRARVPRAR
jgi:hypothetical protein